MRMELVRGSKRLLLLSCPLAVTEMFAQTQPQCARPADIVRGFVGQQVDVFTRDNFPHKILTTS